MQEKRTSEIKTIMKCLGNADQAREFMERFRWPNGPVCPHCNSEKVHRLNAKSDSKRPGRQGLLKCKSCRKQFTVTVGTIFEDTHIPLNKWLMAIYLVCYSKKGISANQLHRMLGITYKSAWFMAHRIRFAMTQPPLCEKLNGIVEIDETYIGGRAKGKRGRGAANKIKVFALVQRDGNAVSCKANDVKSRTLKEIIRNNVADTAHVMTDEFQSYCGLEKQVTAHSVVNHSSKEYVRGIMHTNFAESYFSLLKRGIIGAFHHVSETHIERYLDEFNFRWNNRRKNDYFRLTNTIVESVGKRLIYRDSLAMVVKN